MHKVKHTIFNHKNNESNITNGYTIHACNLHVKVIVPTILAFFIELL